MKDIKQIQEENRKLILEAVQEAKEELKEVLAKHSQFPENPFLPRNEYSSIVELAQNLVNALESIKEPKTDMKEESGDAVDMELMDALGSFKIDFGNMGWVKVTPDIEDAFKAGKKINLSVRYDNEVKGIVECDVNYKEPANKTEESLPDIWKDVGELPDNKSAQDIYFKSKEGVLTLGLVTMGKFYIQTAFSTPENLIRWNEFKTENHKYCTLTDFINQQEQTTKKVAELEKLIKARLWK